MQGISIHALREEGDSAHPTEGLTLTQFLSTPSARRATWRRLFLVQQRRNFYPRPPRGGRHFAVVQFHVVFLISIHALREEDDQAAGRLDPHPEISIHALREEGDGVAKKNRPLGGYFYPRPPRGGRRYVNTIWPDNSRISIHALREEGDQSHKPAFRKYLHISIHALREEGDIC